MQLAVCTYTGFKPGLSLEFLCLQSKLGPPKAMCYQTQRYAMYRGDNLVFETTQVRTPPFTLRQVALRTLDTRKIGPSPSCAGIGPVCINPCII